MNLWTKTKEHYDFTRPIAELLVSKYSEEFEAAYKEFRDAADALHDTSIKVQNRDKSIEEYETAYSVFESKRNSLKQFVDQARAE